MCNDQSMFKYFEEGVDMNIQEIQMGNNSLAKVADRGTMEMDFTSGKNTLMNVLFVHEVRKNLFFCLFTFSKGI